MPSEDDEMTTDSGTVLTKAILTPEGNCVKHPHIRLRGYDSRTRQPYQMDSCPECDKEFIKSKANLQNRKADLDRQLKLLEQSDDKPMTPAARPTIDLDDGSSHAAAAAAAAAAAYPGGSPYGAWPPHPYYAPPPPFAGQKGGPGNPAGMPPHPYYPYMASPPPSTPTESVNSESSKYSVTLLQQKEDELKELRLKYEDSQSSLQEQSIQLALVQSKLENLETQHQAQLQVLELQAQKKAQEEWQTKLEQIREQHQQDVRQLQEASQRSRAEAEAAAVVRMAAEAKQTVPAVPPPAVVPPPTSTPKLDKPKEMPTYSDLDESTVESEPVTVNEVPVKPEPVAAPTNTTSKKHPWKSPNKKPPPTEVAEQAVSEIPPEMAEQENTTPENEEFNRSGDESLWNSDRMLNAGSNHDDGDFVNVQRDESEEKKENTTTPSDRFQPKYVEGNDGTQEPLEATDEHSLGQTVASSTYGEDRQKVTNKSLLDPYGDKGVYTGVVLRSTGMPHGLGRMLYEEDGRIYEGDWRHGRWHGFGRASFSNGDSYEGEYKFDQRHGKGRYQWHDGRVYDGQFSEDKRHGEGTFTWPDGAIYEGAFVNGQRQGIGKYTFADGGQYEGSWKDGRYDGFGTCTWEDGRRYQGEWRNGMAHGQGTETYPNGTVRHDGQWIDDEPVRY